MKLDDLVVSPVYDSSLKLRRHLKAIRENQVSVAYMILYVNGIDFEITAVGPPLASAARECLQELQKIDQHTMTNIWSVSTKDGGMWTTEQRHMLKYGEER